MHACLYFIAPSGHRLKVCKKRDTGHSSEVRSSHHDVFQALDLEFMRRLCTKVNIIPVIGEDFDRKLNLKSLIGRKTICTNICRKSRHIDKNRAGLFQRKGNPLFHVVKEVSSKSVFFATFKEKVTFCSCY